MTLGPVMLDLEGPALGAEERELLAHPAVGGVILFARNYRDPAQLAALVAAIHGLRRPQLLVAVDQEGGRVQRFRDAWFTRLPSAAALGRAWDHDRREGLRLAVEAGWLMAAELRACGVDLSFAPVLDLDRGASEVIGDRALHRDPDAVTALGRAWVRGMREAGMAAVGKHFPGHGGVAADSHLALPVDGRDLATFRLEDLVPFERLAADGLPGLMTAHLLVPAVDAQPVGFSARWIGTLLRRELGYRGAVFSDDLSMRGAAGAGSPPARAAAALAAGCDMVLVCNDRAAASAITGAVDPSPGAAVRGSRLARFHARGGIARAELARLPRRAAARAALLALSPQPELDLDDGAA